MQIETRLRKLESITLPLDDCCDHPGDGLTFTIGPTDNPSDVRKTVIAHCADCGFDSPIIHSDTRKYVKPSSLADVKKQAITEGISWIVEA